jgi:hypothetical protein
MRILLVLAWMAGQDPPPLDPHLLAASVVGGAGDQWLNAVRVRDRKVSAQGEKDFAVHVTIEPDGSAKGTVVGNVNAPHKPHSGLTHVASGKVGPLRYGYNQVAPVLQQPFLEGPGWTLWGWTEAQCKASKAKFAPFMADSGIRLVLPIPSGNYLAVGMSDGGNTSLRVHPRDIDKSLEFPISTGGGAGQSSFVFEITPRGELVRQMVIRGSVNHAAWDKWGRMILVGRGILRGGQPKEGEFAYPDGAGLLYVDAEWKQVLFRTSFGTEGGKDISLWGSAIDSETGISGVCGYVEGPFREVAPVQPRPGGGKDGLVAVIRFWKPETEKELKR